MSAVTIIIMLPCLVILGAFAPRILRPWNWGRNLFCNSYGEVQKCAPPSKTLKGVAMMSVIIITLMLYVLVHPCFSGIPMLITATSLLHIGLLVWAIKRTIERRKTMALYRRERYLELEYQNAFLARHGPISAPIADYRDLRHEQKAYYDPRKSAAASTEVPIVASASIFSGRGRFSRMNSLASIPMTAVPNLPRVQE